jgi:hypothetical protein
MSSLPTNFNLAERSSRPSRRLAARLLPVANLTVYECPQSRTCSVACVTVANVTASSASLRMFHVIPGEKAGTSNALAYDMPIPAGTMTAFEIGITLTTGDRLVAYASTASALCVMLYGSEA